MILTPAPGSSNRGGNAGPEPAAPKDPSPWLVPRLSLSQLRERDGRRAQRPALRDDAPAWQEGRPRGSRCCPGNRADADQGVREGGLRAVAAAGFQPVDL